ncbi:MAG: SUMF1/EgtB/PvdO family nonheme iron enzyme [Microcoleaceae cyanobacterium]
MSIQSQLMRLLANLPKTQTVPERRALLMITGFHHISAKIDSIEKNNFIFFSELVEIIFSEGQEQSLKFLNELVDSEFVGLEAGKKLNEIIDIIATLDSQQFNGEYIENKVQEKVSIPATFSQNIKDLEEPQNTQLIIPSVPGTQTFEFTTVIIDDHGKEINRSQRHNHFLIEDLGNGVMLEMIVIPGGEFLMGSPDFEGSRYSNERPQHSVTIKPFLISKYPITQAQWREVACLPKVNQKLKLLPSRLGGKSHPVTKVSWYDAVEFCDRLSQKIGHQYRLPSEAEWEYACRAGTTTPFHFGETITTDLANYDGNYRYADEPQGIYLEKTTSVDHFKIANNFGLFDMHGNVLEWCLDYWHNNYENAPTDGKEWLDNSENKNRVARGGSFYDGSSICRSSYRFYQVANETFKHIGFRIVHSL